MEVNAVFPEALQFLFQPSRYKIMYGGRGGAKSWGAARALLMMGAAQPIRVLCAREYQNSIKDSVHKLLSDQISAMGLDKPNGVFFYDVQQAVIKGSNGTEISFEGIRHNIGKIKSYEGVNYCWVEEAVNVSKTSWDVLIPTIRRENSEIWATFNPELEEDETYQRFVINPPSNAIVRRLTWRDNPYFPKVLFEEMEELKKKDYDAYLHVWEGHCKTILEGAIYAQEMRSALEEGRITRVRYDQTRSVDTFWDLGYADKTSVWFAQTIGFDYRVIDFYQNSLKSFEHYLKILQGKGYTYGTLWLPHDAKAKSLGTGRSIEELARAKGFTPRIVPKLSIFDGITAARSIFPNCYFDQAACADGLQALRRYKYETVKKDKDSSDKGSLSKNPLHDEYSHAADAFRYLGVALRQPKKRSVDKWRETLGRAAEAAGPVLGFGRPWANGGRQAWMK